MNVSSSARPHRIPLWMVLLCRLKPKFFPVSRMRMSLMMAIPAGIVAGTVLIHGVTREFFETLFSAGVALSPLWVTWVLGFFCESKMSERLLLISTVVHSGWFSFVYREVYYELLEPGTAFMIAGLYSLPVMLPLWIVAFCKRKMKPIQV